MRKLLDGFASVLSSLGLSVTLLVLLALLTWLGTLEQTDHGLYEVQRKYFDSLVLVHWADLGKWSVPIPLPGATLVMGVLFVNLILGGMLRIRKGVATAGILVTHVGIAMLLVAGFVKAYYSEDGHVTLFEGERANEFQSYHRWEIAVIEKLEGRQIRETTAREEAFAGAAHEPRVLRSEALPFDVEVRHFLDNCDVLPKGPMVASELPVVDGFVLRGLERDPENERNIAGAYVTVAVKGSPSRQEGILWGVSRAPLTVEVGGRVFGLELRRERYPMPFTLQMDDFVKEDHPRMSMAKAFSSDVTVLEGGSTRPVKIQMNEPLRAEGLVLYQASWGPPTARPGDRLFSTLAVVRNPADQYPLYSCIVIAIGMVLHFTRKLVRHVRTEARKS